MLTVVNNLFLGHIDQFSQILAVLALIVIGTPLISFDGGIPRFAGIIVGKLKSIGLFILLGVVTMFVIEPLIQILAKEFIQKSTDYVLGTIITLSGLVLWEWDRKMRWDYKLFWVPVLVIGIIILILEAIL